MLVFVRFRVFLFHKVVFHISKTISSVLCLFSSKVVSFCFDRGRTIERPYSRILILVESRSRERCLWDLERSLRRLSITLLQIQLCQRFEIRWLFEFGLVKARPRMFLSSRSWRQWCSGKWVRALFLLFYFLSLDFLLFFNCRGHFKMFFL